MARQNNIYKLHQLLIRSHNPVAKQKIADHLQVSAVTVQRLLDHMRDHFMAPLEYDNVRNGWYYNPTEEKFELPGLWFNAEELYTLLLINQLLQQMQLDLLDNAECRQLQQRIQKLLASHGIKNADTLNRICLIHTAKRQQLPCFKEVVQSIISQRQLHIHYHSRHNNQLTERQVSPQRLVCYRDNWYLDAWCHLRKQIRSFSIDRIQQATLQQQTSYALPSDSLEQHYNATYGIFTGAADNKAILHFNERVARWVSEEQWHSEQQGQWLPEGGYQLTVPYNNPTELIMDLMRYGPEVKVIAPEALKQTVKQRLKEAWQQYE